MGGHLARIMDFKPKIFSSTKASNGNSLKLAYWKKSYKDTRDCHRKADLSEKT